MNSSTTSVAENRVVDRAGSLALVFQEAFTVAVRLRMNRQSASDAQAFRAHVKNLVAGAGRDAQTRGYSSEFVKLAVYAYIAFLDETVLNSTQGLFADWTRQPLQEEIFGDLMAGENFFRYLAELLARENQPDLADVLEVYQLCLLLGFRGKYASNDQGNLQGLLLSIQQKIERIRGKRSAFDTAWKLPQTEKVEVARDPLQRPLVRAAFVAFGLSILLFLFFTWRLHASAGKVSELARQILGGL